MCVGVSVFVFFFFFSSRRRHTRFDCDWSSDVCSSDLALSTRTRAHRRLRRRGAARGWCIGGRARRALPIGRASGGGRGEISVGAGSFKKKKKEISDGRHEEQDMKRIVLW